MSARTLSPVERTRVMRSIRSTNTKPELIVRQVLWALGGRYRLHSGDLPGRPDIVMRSRRLTILVHGCLWHLHEGCRLARMPKSRPDYWPQKLQGNRERDQRNLIELSRLGWRAEVVWECETRDTEKLRNRLMGILEGRPQQAIQPTAKQPEHGPSGLTSPRSPIPPRRTEHSAR
jgi:DNA mismatch endonuclease (patch repair protein)